MVTIKKMADELGEFEVRQEDEAFSLSAVRQTMDNLRFKLRKKEKSGPRDDVFEASRLANQFHEDVSKIDPGLAEKRLSAWSTRLFQDYREKMEDLVKSLHPTPVDIKEMPDLLRKRFIGVNGKHLIQVYPGVNIWERPAMEQFLREMRGVDPDATGNAVHMFESSQLMIQGYIQGGVYAISAILVFIFYTFRNLRATLLVMVPTLVGSLWTVLFMDLFGVQFNMANLVILPLIIGIGVVNGVHILHRFREDPGADNVVLSKSTGQAVVLSSLTTIIGFGSLMTADHMGVYSLGLVLSLGVGSCLLASITLLPAMLKLFAVRGWKV